MQAKVEISNAALVVSGLHWGVSWVFSLDDTSADRDSLSTASANRTSRAAFAAGPGEGRGSGRGCCCESLSYPFVFLILLDGILPGHEAFCTHMRGSVAADLNACIASRAGRVEDSHCRWVFRI